MHNFFKIILISSALLILQLHQTSQETVYAQDCIPGIDCEGDLVLDKEESNDQGGDSNQSDQSFQSDSTSYYYPVYVEDDTSNTPSNIDASDIPQGETYPQEEISNSDGVSYLSVDQIPLGDIEGPKLEGSGLEPELSDLNPELAEKLQDVNQELDTEVKDTAEQIDSIDIGDVAEGLGQDLGIQNPTPGSVFDGLKNQLAKFGGELSGNLPHFQFSLPIGSSPVTLTTSSWLILRPNVPLPAFGISQYTTKPDKLFDDPIKDFPIPEQDSGIISDPAAPPLPSPGGFQNPDLPPLLGPDLQLPQLPEAGKPPCGGEIYPGSDKLISSICNVDLPSQEISIFDTNTDSSSTGQRSDDLPCAVSPDSGLASWQIEEFCKPPQIPRSGREKGSGEGSEESGASENASSENADSALTGSSIEDEFEVGIRADKDLAELGVSFGTYSNGEPVGGLGPGDMLLFPDPDSPGKVLWIQSGPGYEVYEGERPSEKIFRIRSNSLSSRITKVEELEEGNYTWVLTRTTTNRSTLIAAKVNQDGSEVKHLTLAAEAWDIDENGKPINTGVRIVGAGELKIDPDRNMYVDFQSGTFHKTTSLVAAPSERPQWSSTPENQNRMENIFQGVVGIRPKVVKNIHNISDEEIQATDARAQASREQLSQQPARESILIQAEPQQVTIQTSSTPNVTSKSTKTFLASKNATTNVLGITNSNTEKRLYTLIGQKQYTLLKTVSQIRNTLSKKGKVTSTQIKNSLKKNLAIKAAQVKAGDNITILTAGNGQASFNIPIGTYQLSVNPIQGFNISIPRQVEIASGNLTVPVGITKGSGKVRLLSLSESKNPSFIKNVYADDPGNVRVYIFYDKNKNGKLDSDEHLLPWGGLGVTLIKSNLIPFYKIYVPNTVPKANSSKVNPSPSPIPDKKANPDIFWVKIGSFFSNLFRWNTKL